MHSIENRWKSSLKMNRPRKDTKPYIPHEVPSAAADGSLEETVDMMTANEGVPKDVGLRVIICAAHRTRARHARLYGC